MHTCIQLYEIYIKTFKTYIFAISNFKLEEAEWVSEIWLNLEEKKKVKQFYIFVFSGRIKTVGSNDKTKKL